MIDIWQNFSSGIVEFGMNAFSSVEPWTYPLIFMGIIGYVYSATHSIITMVAAILITFALYMGVTNLFIDVPDMTLFMYVIALIGISALVFTLFMKKVVR